MQNRCDSGTDQIKGGTGQVSGDGLVRPIMHVEPSTKCIALPTIDRARTNKGGIGGA